MVQHRHSSSFAEPMQVQVSMEDWWDLNKKCKITQAGGGITLTQAQLDDLLPSHATSAGSADSAAACMGFDAFVEGLVLASQAKFADHVRAFCGLHEPLLALLPDLTLSSSCVPRAASPGGAGSPA